MMRVYRLGGDAAIWFSKHCTERDQADRYISPASGDPQKNLLKQKQLR